MLGALRLSLGASAYILLVYAAVIWGFPRHVPGHRLPFYVKGTLTSSDVNRRAVGLPPRCCGEQALDGMG